MLSEIISWNIAQRYNVLCKVCVLLCIILLSMMDILRLNNIKFHAYHGCLPQERLVGNDYEIDVILRVDLKKAGNSDNLNDTINYAQVYQIVEKCMQHPVNLIEHVAEKMAQEIGKQFSQIDSLDIHLRKLNPPVQGNIQSAEVMISRSFH